MRKSKPLQALVDNIFMKAQNLGYFEGTDPFVLKKSILRYIKRKESCCSIHLHTKRQDIVCKMERSALNVCLSTCYDDDDKKQCKVIS